jgi:hypothetical protein
MRLCTNGHMPASFASRRLVLAGSTKILFGVPLIYIILVSMDTIPVCCGGCTVQALQLPPSGRCCIGTAVRHMTADCTSLVTPQRRSSTPLQWPSQSSGEPSKPPLPYAAVSAVILPQECRTWQTWLLPQPLSATVRLPACLRDTCSDESIVNIAWDSAGVTTGPVTGRRAGACFVMT